MNLNLNLNQNILPKQFSNGRLDIESPSPSAQFALFDKIPISSQCTSFTDAMTGNWNDTPMSLAFLAIETCKLYKMGFVPVYTTRAVVNTTLVHKIAII